MARTSRDDGTNSDSSGQSVSKATNLGQSTPSSNAWLGITEEHITDGSVGPREGMSMTYGGDRNDGILFKGTSANVDSSTAKQLNAGMGGEGNSWASKGQYGPGSPNYLSGGVSARENMTIGGDKNSGQYVGDGVNSTPETDTTQYFISGKVPTQMPTEQFLTGSDQAITRNLSRAKKGIG